MCRPEHPLSSTDSTDYDDDDWIETKEALERELVAKGP